LLLIAFVSEFDEHLGIQRSRKLCHFCTAAVESASAASLSASSTIIDSSRYRKVDLRTCAGLNTLDKGVGLPAR